MASGRYEHATIYDNPDHELLRDQVARFAGGAGPPGYQANSQG